MHSYINKEDENEVEWPGEKFREVKIGCYSFCSAFSESPVHGKDLGDIPL